MGMKEMVFNSESRLATGLYLKMLEGLKHPARNKMADSAKLLNASGLKNGQSALEIGCGSGYFTVQAAPLLGEKGHLTSIDIHPTAVEEVRQVVKELGLDHVWVQQEDAMHTSFENESFDIVLLFGVIPAPVISMKEISIEIYRLLKPGGTCAVWSMMPFWSPSSALRHAPFESMQKRDSVYLLKKS